MVPSGRRRAKLRIPDPVENQYAPMRIRPASSSAMAPMLPTAVTGANEAHQSRTSDGTYLPTACTPLVARIEQRIADLVGWPLEQAEPLQVLHYGPGAEYLPHYDYFDPDGPGAEAALRHGGQRVATLVTYLNTPLSGGATTFPDAGLEFAAVQGNAVFFSYDRAHPSSRTLHAGAPVIAGEKWVLTRWFRERRFG